MPADGGRVLIVDDSPEMLGLLQALLRKEYELAVATSGEECLEKLRQFSPDLVLLDVMMPGIDGYETCRRIKSGPCGDFVQVVLVSAKGSAQERLEGYQAGADDYVAKPFDHQELLAKVRVQFRLRSTLEKLWSANAQIQSLNAEMADTNLQLQQEIADRRRVQQELQVANRDLQQKNAELDEFTYVASHDLQEPVRKLIAFSQLLQEDLGLDLCRPAEEDLLRIVDGAKRMQRLIEDLLHLSRVGRAAVDLQPLSLQECLDEVLDGLALRIEESGAEIVRHELPQVVGDRTILRQLYHNLVGNALKFVGPDRPTVHLTAQRDGPFWILGVKDNGIGIKAQYAEDVFKPFKRLHGQSKYSGTGIGLAICRKAVDRHGGKIWVESEYGRGAHFQFTLPALAEQEEASCTSQPQTA